VKKEMKKTALFLAVFCLIIASVAAQNYTIPAKNFTGLSESQDQNFWCYYDRGGYECYAKMYADGAAAKHTDANNHPATYNLSNLTQGLYNISVTFYDKNTYNNPKIKIGSKEYNLTTNPQALTTVNLGVQQINKSDKITLNVVLQGGSNNNKYILIDNLFFEKLPEQQSHQNPELGIIGMIIAVTVVTVYFIVTRKK
jgi:uncharacterized protein (DUF2141 family)